QRIIALVRDDRRRRDQGLDGPFMRLEAKDDYLKLDGLEVSAKFPATVYEPGVLFLKATLFRKVLQGITGDRFLSIQATKDEVVMDMTHLPLVENEMLLYHNPNRAPQRHPDDDGEPEPQQDTQPNDRQLLLWDYLSWGNGS
ncbi:MAG: hypothetical protein IH991_18020, partial [Planctomycetes bacterium]|nr:hypothetical protein [Planctomycetota bacterium]